MLSSLFGSWFLIERVYVCVCVPCEHAARLLPHGHAVLFSFFLSVSGYTFSGSLFARLSISFSRFSPARFVLLRAAWHSLVALCRVKFIFLFLFELASINFSGSGGG